MTSVGEPAGEPVAAHLTPVPEPAGAGGERPIPGPARGPALPGRVAAPRLARHVIQLEDGHRVGLAVSGRGVPLVVVHGFTVEGFLYAQTLSRLVAMGFKVIAIDTAGHGATAGLPRGGGTLGSYADLLGRALDELGIKRAVFAGHSMGGRIVAELVATQPKRGIGVILVDAIVGEPWDRIVRLCRVVPPLLLYVGATLVIDTAATVPLLANPRQATKLGRLMLPTLADDVRRPWRLIGPGVSILRSRGSRWLLDRLARAEVPVFALHGTRDLGVPLATARSAAKRARGQFIAVEGGTHSWLLADPETLPAIVAELLDGRLGDAYRDALEDAGLDPLDATVDQVEGALYEPGAKILDLTPPLDFEPTLEHRHRPRYQWRVQDFGGA
jgi:pimeloyl-ACP methyl ester carboxylesterase